MYSSIIKPLHFGDELIENIFFTIIFIVCLECYRFERTIMCMYDNVNDVLNASEVIHMRSIRIVGC